MDIIQTGIYFFCRFLLFREQRIDYIEEGLNVSISELWQVLKYRKLFVFLMMWKLKLQVPSRIVSHRCVLKHL